MICKILKFPPPRSSRLQSLSKKRFSCAGLDAKKIDGAPVKSYVVSSALWRFLAVVMVDDSLAAEEQQIQQRIKTAMRAYRRVNHLTQEEMAGYLQISHKNYASYESRPDRWVPIALIIRFCDLSETSTQWIFRQLPPAPPYLRFTPPAKSTIRRKV